MSELTGFELVVVDVSAGASDGDQVGVDVAAHRAGEFEGEEQVER